MKGKGSSEGIPQVMGFVPIMGSTPQVGAMEGLADVVVMPIENPGLLEIIQSRVEQSLFGKNSDL